jgi:acrylyl-CoA reductase (NADPH)
MGHWLIAAATTRSIAVTAWSKHESLQGLSDREKEGLTQGRFVTMDESQLDPGEVTIKVAFSSVNYKDALAATGAGRIIRRYPCVGGIDLSGTVAASTDPRFRAGDAVIATSFDIGVAHHGGYAEYASVPAQWVVPCLTGLSLHEAMALGTAGFTAALGVVRMEENGLAPSKGPVIVTGATGGVGSLAVDMLAARGYQVTALTGKDSAADYLRGSARTRSCSARHSTCRASGRSTRRSGRVPSITSAAMSWPGSPAP